MSNTKVIVYGLIAAVCCIAAVQAWPVPQDSTDKPEPTGNEFLGRRMAQDGVEPTSPRPDEEQEKRGPELSARQVESKGSNEGTTEVPDYVEITGIFPCECNESNDFCRAGCTPKS